MRKIKLIIFDLDGTLVDSLDDLTDATNHMLRVFNRPELDPRQVRKLVGQGARRLVERAMPAASDGEIGRGLAVFLEYNSAHIADRSRLYPGVRETLDALLDGGIRLAVISNKNVLLCRQLLETLAVGEYFEAVLGADSVREQKPSPQPVLQLMHDMAVEPHDTVMIGDSINDIAAGKGAGVVTVGCTYGYGESDELTGADYRVDSFAELIGLPPFRMTHEFSPSGMVT